MSSGVYLLEPAPPRVMQTATISQPARAHFASVPPTVNSWSSGCAWMLMTRAGAAGSGGAGGLSGGTSGGAPSDSGLVAMATDYPPNGRSPPRLDNCDALAEGVSRDRVLQSSGRAGSRCFLARDAGGGPGLRVGDGCGQ